MYICSCRPGHVCLKVDVCMHVCPTYVKISSLPGQHLSKHVTLSVLSPTQFAPPLDREGLLHERVRTRVPVPHVTLHLPNFQGPQPPSTVNTILALFKHIYTTHTCIRTYMHTHNFIYHIR